MTYDYLIKNGTVVDFVNQTTRVQDIYVKDGKIADATGDEDIEVTKLVDAAGKFVVPGLVDEHFHCDFGSGFIGANADMVCPSTGVTTTCDAGSTGCNNFERFYRDDIIRYMTDVRAYLHVSSFGVKANCKHEEDHDPADIQKDKIIALFKKYPNELRGLKVRYSIHTMGEYGFEPLKKAVEIADELNDMGYHCHVAVHMAELPVDMDFDEFFSIMRPGDVYTHLYQNLGPAIIDNGKVRDSFKKAREKGVLFSTGNGGMHWCFDNYEQCYKEGFYPDIISSDIVKYNQFLVPSFNLCYHMNTNLAMGMTPVQVLKAVTYNPAKALGLLEEVGTLEVGTKADIAILDLVDKEMDLPDRFGRTVKTKQIFVPLMTIKEGVCVFRQVFFVNGYGWPKLLKNYVEVKR